jgi:hypothetical protein
MTGAEQAGTARLPEPGERDCPAAGSSESRNTLRHILLQTQV